jgi:hypothetical protein
VSPAEEVPFGREGYDDDVDGSRVKDDMEGFVRGVRSGLSRRNCDSATGENGRLENGLERNDKKINIPIASESVVEAEVIVTGAEGIAKTEG